MRHQVCERDDAHCERSDDEQNVFALLNALLQVGLADSVEEQELQWNNQWAGPLTRSTRCCSTRRQGVRGALGESLRVYYYIGSGVLDIYYICMYVCMYVCIIYIYIYIYTISLLGGRGYIESL